MVSERRLAERMESYWSDLTPNLSATVRRLNLDGYIMEHPPITGEVSPSRMFLVSEIAFETVARSYPNRPTNTATSKTATDYALGIIDRFTGSDSNADISSDFSKEEIEFATKLAVSMGTLVSFYARDRQVNFRELIVGHAIVDHCEVDASAEDILFEFKATERPLSSSDLRQILVYLALCHLSGRPMKTSILHNPRLGRTYVMPVLDLVLSVGGVPPVEFFSKCRDVFTRLLLEEQR